MFVTKVEAMRLFEMDIVMKDNKYPGELDAEGNVRGHRGIINARLLGLSKHRYRAAKDPKRKVIKAWNTTKEQRAGKPGTRWVGKDYEPRKARRKA